MDEVPIPMEGIPMSVANRRRVRRKRSRREAPASADVRPEISVVPPRYFAWKGILDRVIAAVLLVPGLPMIVGLILLVRLTSRGPGLFRQARTGRGGRVFWMVKIRTMRLDAEKGTGPVWTQAGDPRVTRVGKVLRRLHLDELPQLFNVLCGHMSLIGPRPERPEFVKVLKSKVPGYLDRLAVRPGITGLAQINLPPDSDTQSVRRKLVLDLEYINKGGLWLDLRIFLCTLARLLWLPGDRVASILRIRREVILPPASAPAAPGDGGTLPAVPSGSTIISPVGDHEGNGQGAAGSGNGDHREPQPSADPRKPR